MPPTVSTTGAPAYDFFDAPVITRTNKTFKLFSPKLGISYELTDRINLFGMVAQSGQVPSEAEIQSNTELDAATARNIEVGLKGRALAWSFDLSVYHTIVRDEIVSVLRPDNTTEFQNAGETRKDGLEFAGRYDFNDRFWIGASYAFSDYEFVDFLEEVGYGPYTTEEDRSGNQLPFIPRHQYSLSTGYNHPSGFRMRLQADTWGSYYMDNANTEKYAGYDFLTSLMLGYQTGPHSFALNLENLTDKRYATEVKKNTDGEKVYYAGAPRSALAGLGFLVGGFIGRTGNGKQKEKRR